MSEKLIEIDNRLQRIEGLLLQKKRVLNFKEAVIMTGLSPSYLYRLNSEGKIPHYSPGGKMVYYDREELELWLLSNKSKSIEELDQQASNYLLNK